MPLDAICLSALTSELGEKLTGGRICPLRLSKASPTVLPGTSP